MLKIALCDDNRDCVQQYADLIEDIAKKHHIAIEISRFYSGEALFFHYGEGTEQVDIIYLDILMDRTDGMETARKLRDCHCKAQIIFLTSHEDAVFEAFDVNAVQYLLKEETCPERFEQVFLKAASVAAQKEEELFTFEFDGVTHVIPLLQISYFEIWKRRVTVHYDHGKTAEFYFSMQQLEKNMADKGFVRVHRSFLVHLSYISNLQQQSLLLKTGEVIPVGITYAQSLKRTFSQYISRLSIYNRWQENVETQM